MGLQEAERGGGCRPRTKVERCCCLPGLFLGDRDLLSMVSDSSCRSARKAAAAEGPPCGAARPQLCRHQDHKAASGFGEDCAGLQVARAALGRMQGSSGQRARSGLPVGPGWVIGRSGVGVGKVIGTQHHSPRSHFVGKWQRGERNLGLGPG